MKLTRARICATVVSLAVVLGVAAIVPRTKSVVAQGKTLRWIINGPAVPTFTTDPTAQAFFANTHPFVVVRKDLDVTLPSSWGALRTQIFPSFLQFERAVNNGKIRPETKAVLYDNEAWDFTPEEEQTNLADYAQRFAELAHQHGYLVIVTPAVDLAKSRQEAGERRFSTFLRLNIPAAAAKYADVYEIQAQGSQVPANVFASYVTGAAQQARAANPKVLVFAGLSTNPSGHKMTADGIVAAVRATRDVVDGYWFNVPQKNPSCPNCNDFRPDIAIDVMRQLQSSH
jgi:hypothetical protein